jgi:hypothetical protein
MCGGRILCVAEASSMLVGLYGTNGWGTACVSAADANGLPSDVN